MPGGGIRERGRLVAMVISLMRWTGTPSRWNGTRVGAGILQGASVAEALSVSEGGLGRLGLGPGNDPRMVKVYYTQ